MRLLVLIIAALPALATQITDNDVRDLAGRKIATGTITVCPASSFESSSGFTVTKDCVKVAIAGGRVSVDLLATDTATPSGQYYRARWQTSTTWDEYWLVPTSASPLRIRDVIIATPPTPDLVWTLNHLNVGQGAPDGDLCISVENQTVTGVQPCKKLVNITPPAGTTDGNYCLVVEGGQITGLAACSNAPTTGLAFDSYSEIFDSSAGLFDAH